MPSYILTSPSGQKFQITAPDGATQDQIAAVARTHIASQQTFQPADPSAGGSTLQVGPFDTGVHIPQAVDRTLAGAGKGFVDLARGAGQDVGLESRQDVADSRKLDAPLMKTTAGKVGNVAGTVAATLPALAIPGANTVAGAAALGAATGALQPSASTKETVANVGLGAAAGGAGQWLGNRISGAISSHLASRQAAADTEEALNSERDAILQRSREAGYVVPPTAANPSAVATAAESVSGKAATRQAAGAANAKVTNGLVRDDLGIPTNQPITRGAIAKVRNTAGQVYQQVKGTGTIATDPQFQQDIQALTQVGTDLEEAAPGIGAQASQKVSQLSNALAQPQFTAKQAVGLFKFLNNRAKSGFQAAFKSGDPEALDLARAQRSAADAMGDLIDRHLTSSGQGDLAKAWSDARTTIAKTYMAEAALKGNNVDALRLAAQMRKNSPITGGFRTAAQFADQFGEVARVPKSGVGVSKLAAAIGGGGAVTSLALGHPEVAAAEAALAAMPYLTRKAILSDLGQRLLATPNYAPSAIGTTALKGARLAVSRGAIPAYAGGRQLVEAPQ